MKTTLVSSGELSGEHYQNMWDKNPQVLIKNLQSCLKLNEVYQEQYKMTKEKLLGEYEKIYTRNEWRRCETTLETSGEDVK